MGQELCERANIDCGKDSRLKLKIDPTIDQDRYISNIPEEKKENTPTSSPGGSSGSGAPVGSHDCSYWEDCVVKSST